MMNRSKFDEIVEQFSRRIAGRTSRRSFISRVGTAVAGAALVPLLPVDRSGRVSRSHASEADNAGPSNTREGWKPQDTDIHQCDYWRHCSLDGYICGCAGGSLTDCPPGTKLSTSSWV
ncbi:methylamine dehydrogenase light chain, partial [Hyphomicrobium sp.]|uniref:methylamine dehydrogenase light chain n=1 Tax=Hyphomicrobium sp. TaxID=82 RepID=UPI002FDD86C2